VVQGRALLPPQLPGCHSGTNWTASQIDFTPPPAATEITAAQLNPISLQVGSFDAASRNELKGGGVADS